MLQLLVHLIIDAITLLVAARFIPRVRIKSFNTALFVAILIGVLSFLLSWLFTSILHIATLGIFYFLGIGFIIRIVAYAFIIEIANRLSRGFKTIGFMPSLYLAIILATVSAIVDLILF